MAEKGFVLVNSEGELQIVSLVNLEDFLEEEAEKGNLIADDYDEDGFKKYIVFKGMIYNDIFYMKKALPATLHHILGDVECICVGKRKVATLNELSEVKIYPL